MPVRRWALAVAGRSAYDASMRSKVVLAILVLAAVLGTLWRRHETQAPPSRRERAGNAALVTRSAPASEVRRLAPGDRKQLGEDIHVAIRRAGSNSGAEQVSGVAGPAQTLPDEPLLHLEEIGPAVKAALESTIPEFEKCYAGRTGANKAPIAIMEMVSDPDLGTVIDTTQMIDADGNPLPEDIDDCLRATADSLALPPLGKPGRLPIQYSFYFH